MYIVIEPSWHFVYLIEKPHIWNKWKKLKIYLHVFFQFQVDCILAPNGLTDKGASCLYYGPATNQIPNLIRNLKINRIKRKKLLVYTLLAQKH